MKKHYIDRFGIETEINDNISILIDRQLDVGGWAPIGKTSNPRHIRTYSTVMALWAMTEAYKSGLLSPDLKIKSERAIRNGMRFLLETYKTNQDGLSGWWPNPNTQPQVDFFPGLTAQVLFTFIEAATLFPDSMKSVRLENAINAFSEISIYGSANTNSLISRKISENQRLHDSDRYLDGRTEMVEGSTFLWYPWSLILAIELNEKARGLFNLETDPHLLVDALLANNEEALNFASKDPVIYPSAEIAFAFNKSISFMSGSSLKDKSR